MQTWALDALPAVGWAVAIGLIGLLIGIVGARLFRRWVGTWSQPLGPGRANLLGKLAGYAFFVLTVAWTLNAAGLPLSGMLGWVAGAAGIAGVAIGFASQTSASNVISGLFLLGERPFEEGDFVIIGGTAGQVLAVELLSVKLRTFDNLFVRVPNETAMKSTITNISRFKIRRIDLILRFPPDAPLERVKQTLDRTADATPYILTQPAPSVLFSGFADGMVELQLSAWASAEAFGETRGKWVVELLAAINKAGLTLVGGSRAVRLVGPAPQAASAPPEPPPEPPAELPH
ncbi:MAG: mechanosensitive ion channel family protein [Deltaproteobacteria bacterium]|nr:MAG: mechanosensitive ion channel family protein [Deltaproteobacteria bacterium]